MTNAISAIFVFPEIRRVAITKKHMVLIVEFNHSWQCLTFIQPQLVRNNLSCFFFDPVNTITGSCMTDFVSAIWCCVSRAAGVSGLRSKIAVSIPSEMAAWVSICASCPPPRMPNRVMGCMITRGAAIGNEWLAFSGEK